MALGGLRNFYSTSRYYSHTISYPFINYFFSSNLLEHVTEGLAWRPELINCDSSEKGLGRGAWRLALGGLSSLFFLLLIRWPQTAIFFFIFFYLPYANLLRSPRLGCPLFDLDRDRPLICVICSRTLPQFLPFKHANWDSTFFTRTWKFASVKVS